MKGAATWIGFTLAAASAVWGGEAPASPGKNPPRVGGEVEISSLPFDVNEIIRTVRKNRGLPEEPPKQGFHTEARGERPFVSKGNAFSHETPRFQAKIGEDGLRYFAQGNKEKPDFEILSVSFERGGVPRQGRGKSQTVFGKGRLEEHAPGLLQGETLDGITPYVRNRGEEGIEIYWTIDEPLSPGASALHVRLAIRAAGEPREHPEGLIFPTWDGSGQVAFSNVTVVDSAGRLERIRPSLATSQEILFEVSREFLENTRYPILIDPTVGPEFPVEPSPVIGPAPSSQGDPSATSNGTDYFVAWQDARIGAGNDIYGARVASDGTVLDPMGIAVSTAAEHQLYLSVASDGTDYFVAWEDRRNDGGCLCNWDIYGARVASDGTALDPAGIAVSTAANHQYSPSVASDGTDYFVAWQDDRSGMGDIYGARVTSAGTVLDPAGIAVSTAVSGQRHASVASNGTDYFVAWMDVRSGTSWDIYGTRVASAGTVLDPAGIAVSTAVDWQLDPSAASDGTDYFVAWEDRRNDGGCFCNWDIYGARVRASDGLLLDGPPDTGGIAVSTVVDNQEVPSVASNGTDYFVAWQDYRNSATTSWDIYGARVRATDGVLLDGPPDTGGIAVSTAASGQYDPSVASNGTDYFVAWDDNRNSWDIYGARVASAGTVLDPTGIAVSTAASGQYGPSVASNGTDYFVAWTDYRSFVSYDIYGARVTAAGVVLDASGIAVSTAANGQSGSSVASNGTDYFVAWEDLRSGADYDIYGTRVQASDGSLLDGPPDTGGIAVSTAADHQRNSSVASNGTDYFVAWHDYRSGTSYDIYGTRVASSDGTVLDPAGIAVSTAADDQYCPAVASNGTDYFVAWEDYRIGTGYSDIYGARVASDGTVLDPTGIAVSTAADDQYYPSVASNWTDYFVAWRDYRNDGGCWCNVDIYGTRVASVDGTVLDGPPDTGGIAVSTAADNQHDPSVASNGTDYFVVWGDYRSGTDWDIYGARVASAGTVLDAAGILIQQSLYDDQAPAVAYSSCGKYLATYYRFYDDPNFQSRRIMARTVEDDVPSAGEVSAPGSGRPLTVERASGQVKIFWEGLPSDCAGVIQYNIYEGDLDSFPPYNHLSLVCWTAGTDEGGGYLSEIVTPGFANAYYLVTECDTATEGTSGYDSDAVERNPALNTCGPHP